MKNFLFQIISLSCIQILLVLVLSPLINTLIKKLKALLQGRQGPPLMQGYYDLLKYFHKETVVSKQTSWLFLFTPFIFFTTALLASLVVPTFINITPLNIFGGVIFFVYILSLGRFFMALASMEPGSGFCGMASSREMMLALLIEPVMLLSLFVLVLMSGSINLQVIIDWLSDQGVSNFSPSYFLSMLALLVVVIAEMGRVPFDNPETHYELTMIHEGMLLEYSGKQLGLMFWGNWIKQVLVLSLVANLFFPHGISMMSQPINLLLGFMLYFCKLLVLCIVVALVETVFAKVRLFRVKDILVTSFVSTIIALVLFVKHKVGGLN